MDSQRSTGFRVHTGTSSRSTGAAETHGISWSSFPSLRTLILQDTHYTGSEGLDNILVAFPDIQHLVCSIREHRDSVSVVCKDVLSLLTPDEDGSRTCMPYLRTIALPSVCGIIPWSAVRKGLVGRKSEDFRACESLGRGICGVSSNKSYRSSRGMEIRPSARMGSGNLSMSTICDSAPIQSVNNNHSRNEQIPFTMCPFGDDVVDDKEEASCVNVSSSKWRSFKELQVPVEFVTVGVT